MGFDVDANCDIAFKYFCKSAHLGNGDASFECGKYYYHHYENEFAEEYLRSALDDNKDDKDAKRYLANVYSSMNKIDINPVPIIQTSYFLIKSGTGIFKLRLLRNLVIE